MFKIGFPDGILDRLGKMEWWRALLGNHDYSANCGGPTRLSDITKATADVAEERLFRFWSIRVWRVATINDAMPEIGNQSLSAYDCQ